jgi:hypothetical protein
MLEQYIGAVLLTTCILITIRSLFIALKEHNGKALKIAAYCFLVSLIIGDGMIMLMILRALKGN